MQTIKYFPDVMPLVFSVVDGLVVDGLVGVVFFGSVTVVSPCAEVGLD